MIRERLELHFDTLPEQSGQRSRLCGTVLSGLGVSRREPGCPGRAPGFLRRPLVFGLRKGAVWPDGADGSALPTKPVNSATRLARVMIAKMAASGPSSKKPWEYPCFSLKMLFFQQNNACHLLLPVACCMLMVQPYGQQKGQQACSKSR